MHFFSRNKTLIVASMAAVGVLAACGDDVTVPAQQNTPVVISLTPQNASVNVGESIMLSAQITGGSTTTPPTLASCTSSNTSTLSVTRVGNACEVTGVAAGNASITAKASTGQETSAIVTVNAATAAISGLSVVPSSVNLGVGQTQALTPSVTRANPANQVTYSYSSSATNIATVNATTGVVTAVAPGTATITVTATGSGTGYSNATLTTNAVVVVSSLPSGVSSFTLTPSNLPMLIGATSQLVPTVQQPAGAAAATFTYSTNAASVATVSASGLVTAVGPGTAVITATATSAANANYAASSLSATSTVTVSPAAQVSLATFTQNNIPVDLTNVNGQIEVGVNLATNGNIVTGVQLFSCPVATPDCPTAGQLPIAQQTFGVGGAASGPLQFIINTADFTMAPNFASATPTFLNGQRVLVATVTVAGQTTSQARSTGVILNLNNVDGFAVSHTPPGTAVIASNGNAFFGGPTNRGTVIVVPVMYTAGRTVSSATVAMTGCGTNVSFTSASTLPWTLTYGKSDPAGATHIACPYETPFAGAPDVFPTITSWTDNSNVAGTPILVTTGFKTTTSNVVAVTAPAAIRVDFVNPSAPTYTMQAQTNAVAGWVNSSYSFIKPAGAANNNFTATDLGSGINVVAPKLEIRGCGTTTYAALTAYTGAAVNECGTNVSATAYEIRYTAEDVVGNASSSASASALFGVDKTAPFIRLGAATDASGTIYKAPLPVVGTVGDTTFQAEAIDERSGINITQYQLARADNFTSGTASQVRRSGYCANIGSNTGIGALFITAPVCGFTNTTLSATPLVDGYRVITSPANTYSNLAAIGNGYYTFGARVFDAAGNPATTEQRYVLVNPGAPVVTVDAPLSIVTAASGITVTGKSVGTVEVEGQSIALNYTDNAAALHTFQFPAVATGRTAFDNVTLAAEDAFSGTLPFTSGVRFYTNLEFTSATNTVDNVKNATATSQNIFGFNHAGFGAFGAAQPITATGDNTAWATKSPNLLRFEVVDSTAGFNSPVGGLKARATSTTDLVASPFSRVDFYLVTAANTYSYLGSADGSGAPCSSGTCSLYLSDNGITQNWTYVLRSAASSATSLAPQMWLGAAAGAALVPPVAGSTIIAVGTYNNPTIAGRVLVSQPFTLP